MPLNTDHNNTDTHTQPTHHTHTPTINRNQPTTNHQPTRGHRQHTANQPYTNTHQHPTDNTSTICRAGRAEHEFRPESSYSHPNFKGVPPRPRRRNRKNVTVLFIVPRRARAQPYGARAQPCGAGEMLRCGIHTHGHGNYMTDLAQRGDSVKTKATSST